VVLSMTAGSPHLGPYELIDRFAVGGVAEIYRARDTRNGELVVIKRMRPDLGFDPDLQAGFLRELQLAILCKHKNLIRGLDKGNMHGIEFGVLEYVDGQDLARICERARKANIRLPLAFATFITGEILEGLEFAHHIRDARGRSLGLVHRDISPKNIFVRYDGEVRVGDFGSSLATRTEEAHGVVGSPGFISPEQVRMEKLDGRSDVFAVGCILYELVVGAPAFDVAGKKDDVILKVHGKGKINDIPAWVPPGVRLCIELGCAPDRTQRYQTAAHMREALDHTEAPPDPDIKLGIATLVRKLFPDEFRATRLPGNPLTF
jgi:serine/threonine protein kinase